MISQFGMDLDDSHWLYDSVTDLAHVAIMTNDE